MVCLCRFSTLAAVLVGAMNTTRGAKSAVRRTFRVLSEMLQKQMDKLTIKKNVNQTYYKRENLQSQIFLVYDVTRHNGTSNLWFHIQQRDFSLLVDLLNCLNFGTEHIPLEAAVLQQLVCGDALGHVFVRDEIVLFAVGLILTLGSGGVCVQAEQRLSKNDSWRSLALEMRGRGSSYVVQGRKTSLDI